MKLHNALICALAILLMAGLVADAREVGTTLGAKAPAFAGTDINGDPVDLAALNADGKFVMVDFWASWCGPCMGELPNVLAFLKDFDNPSFEMISCSLDNEKTLEKLNQVIAENDIPYPVIYDGGYWKAQLAVDWGISSIPATFLVNPDGVIVMRNIRGEAGLENVRRIVEEAPDFVPPEFGVAVDLETDFSTFTTVIELPALPAGDHTFSYGYYFAYKGDDDQPVQVMKDWSVRLNITESDEGNRGFLIEIKGADEEEFASGDVSYEEQDGWGRLAITAPLGHEVGYVRIGLDYHDLSLDTDLNIAYIYARPPKPETEEEEA